MPHGILEAYPTSAESAQISLLCCQPELISGASPADYVEIMRHECERRRQEALASAQGKRHAEPRQQKRTARKGAEDGLHHLASEGKRLREVAKLIDKKIGWERDRRAKGEGRLSDAAWRGLLNEREEAWDKAEDISDRAGHPYKNRHGVMVNCARADLVSVCLGEWCKKHGLTLSAPARTS